MWILLVILVAVVLFVALMVGGWGGPGAWRQGGPDRVVRRRVLVRRPARRVVRERVVDDDPL